MSFTPEQTARARTARKSTIEARKASRVQSADGWLVYHDSPPGIGWVLAPPSTDADGSTVPGGGKPLRYFADRAMCLHTYHRLTGKEFAP